MAVPYLDLGRARERIADEVAERWRRVLAATAFVQGPEVREFEGAFAEFLGAAGCVGVANGTDALVLCLRALGVKAGDEVIVPAFTFFATAEAVVLAGGVPVFADVDPATLNLDPADAAARVTARTVGVMGVHLYGRPFEVGAIQELCDRHGLWLVEDAAQAHGASLDGRKVGTFGLAAWSFYPTKNLGAYGDGGAVTGPDAELLAKVRRLANHGCEQRYVHLEVGTNSRLDSLQAAVLNCRLARLDEDNAARRKLACKYQGGLGGVGDLTFPVDRPGAFSVYHQFAVRTARRDELMAHLAARGIGSSIHYPAPLHRQAAMAQLLPDPPSLPAAEAAARELLCLPMFPELTEAEVDEVTAAARRFYGEI
jgi:dTDP-4-amino-4,6-dideoxygalactose transaminase